MPAEDPLTELDSLAGQLAALEKKFAAREIEQADFELLSKQLKERMMSTESLAYVQARKDKILAKRLRARNYNDSLVQQACSHFVFGRGGSLEPSFGVDRIPRYFIGPDKEHMVEVERALLERMAQIGILVESLYEKILYCPKCATPSNVYTRFKCTQCGSIDISMNRMIEHLQCGTIHQETAFRAGPNMICPTCKKLIQRNEEYRLIGVVGTCRACGAHFGDPAQSFFCRKCEVDFSLPTAIVVDVFTYTMDKTALEEVRSQLGVPVVAGILTEAGFEVMAPGSLVSASGESYEFPIMVRKNSKLVVIEIAQSNSEIEVEPLLEFYVKLIEAKPAISIFAAVPRLSKKAQGVASLHNILVAEGANAAEAAREIVEIVKAA